MAQSDGGRKWSVGRYTDHRHRLPFGLGWQYASHSTACHVGRMRGAACPRRPRKGGTATTFLARVFADTANFAGHARGPRTADRCNGGVRDQLYFIVGWRSASNRDARQWRNFSASGFIIRMYLDIRPKHGRSDGSAPPCCSDGGLSRYVARAVTGESTGRSHLGKRRFAAARNSEPEHT